ncbi:D-Ala-D-Ala carboxypeptidase family metallohydrolase [Microbulbifer sp. 2205BS26-8]|uniref:D-Ala-D-Ala carboxypeptidase family metallohydrolase n=1 Tax=Microbulbifer sp. 2205BS26-8 TaxID=3064386 RepID=UPI00273CFF23|nr:D-Ala-D-Ala carboxypeptidase family metallohydrolase [Microbulbifer sp. 2205BS26-8]MDP5210009.1 D-Ala-D-Ala carboxypeptidase family metallohydrolase [Microbulbifer sp. 2205BS26-8]
MFDNEHFTERELSCRCCGKLHFSDDTLCRLIRVRKRFNKPIVITSGYRCQAHCARIGSTMTHTTGQAVDVSVSGGRAYELLGIAIEEGFTGIGVKQHGPYKGRFLHLDDLGAIPGKRTGPTIWSYPR